MLNVYFLSWTITFNNFFCFFILQNFLFDGLEDEEPSLGNAAFLPKRSVKKLVLKNLGANRSITLTSDISGDSNQTTRIDVSISMNKSNKPSKIFTDTSPTAVPLTVDISDTYV